MTAIPSIGRAFAARSITRVTSQLSSATSLRVTSSQSALVTRQHPFSQIAASYSAFWEKRTYATGSGATAEPSSTKKTTTKKPAKKTAKKPARKSKRKAKPKKEPTEAQQAKLEKRKANKAIKDARAKTKALRETALIGKEPKGKPRTAWGVVTVESTKGRQGPLTDSIKAAKQKYQNLSLSEREHYNHVANQNKQDTALAYKKWVESHTPAQIRDANNARTQLNILKRKTNPKAKRTYRAIHDERLVRRPVTQYTLFSKDRHGSGDLNGMTIAERSKLIGSEWKALSESEKRSYKAEADRDLLRYRDEYKSVYGQDSPSSRRK